MKRVLQAVLLVLAVAAALPLWAAQASALCTTAANCPPPTNGYFSTSAVGASLPSGADCAATIGPRQSQWEPRPDNYKRNHVMPVAADIHASLASRPRSHGDGTIDPLMDSYILARVDGQYTGSTDQILQWAACKWGIADNILRAQAVRESTWYQYDVYPGDVPRPNRCAEHWSCGDRFSGGSTPDSVTYCNGLASIAGGNWDYQLDGSPWGSGLCPKTFGILGVMSWEDPAWQAPYPPYAGNQNGMFPFNRNSTAAAADYEAAFLRGCYEGYIHYGGFQSGDIWGCVGAWFSGAWHDGVCAPPTYTGAEGYICHVQEELNNHTWLTTAFANTRPPVDPNFGPAAPDTL